MNVESAEVALAYTYAWWLTGSEQAARTAVLAAVARPEVPGADAELRREILLRRVRAAAVTAPTMCPASELALLHDAIGIGLDSAAGLANVDAREARTELAHGRLEALGPDVQFEITHPERLGGLAVGNPADVAAARQNESLGHLREMILTGRDELIDIAKITVPQDLLDEVAERHGPPLAAERGTDDLASIEDQESIGEADPDEESRPPDDAAMDGEPGVIESEPLEPEWFVGVGDDEDDEPSTDVVDRESTDEAPPAAPDIGQEFDEDAVEVDEFDVGQPDADDADEREDLFDEPHDDEPYDDEPYGDELFDDEPYDEEFLDEADTDEIDLSDVQDEPELGTPGRPRRRTPWGWIVVALLIATLVGLYFWRTSGRDSAEDQTADDVTSTTVEGDDPDGAPAETDAADEPAPATDASPDDASEEVAETSDPEADDADSEPTEPADPGPAFVLSRAGVAVGIGSEPDFDNPTADPFDPISVSIEYDGAEPNDALIAEWTVDGEPFGVERADLSPGQGITRFTRQVPQVGWPAGQHSLELTLERTGASVGVAEFEVVGGPTLEEQQAEAAGN